MSTLADYNNNPGNLKPPKGLTYEGQIGVDDNGFAVFENKDYGRKALVQDLEAKIKRGVNTPEKFIDIYSPAGAENEETGRDNYKLYLVHKLGLKGTGEPFGKEHIDKLADAITAFEGGTWAGGKKEDKAAQAAPAEPAAGVVPELPTDGRKLTEPLPSDKEAEQQPEINPVIGGLAGGMLGSLSGTTVAVAQAKLEAAKRGLQYLAGQNAPAPTPGAPAPTTTGPAGGETPGGKWAAKTGYGMGEGTVQDVASRYQRAMPAGKVSGPYVKKFGPAMPGEPRDLVERMIQRKAAQEAAQAAQVAQEAQAAQALQAEAAAAQRGGPLSFMRFLSYPVRGALSGALTGFSAADAYNRYKANKPGEAAVSGVGGLAGLASMAVPSMGFLPAISVAAPLYLQASDRLKYLEKHPEAIQLEESNVDPMGFNIR